MPTVGGPERVIDLGEDFDLPPATPRVRSWRSAQRSAARRFAALRSAARRSRLAVPVCAVLFLVTAASPAPVPPLRLIAQIQTGVDASVMIEGSGLYVYDMTGIKAYTLDGGTLRWSAPAPELATETTMSYLDGRVIVSMADTDLGGEHTVAFDASTGRRLWTSEFGFAVPAAGGVLVESAPRQPGFNFPGTVVTASFRLLDPGTGRTLWSVDVDDNCVTELASPTDEPAMALLELCSNSSRLTEIDLSDGHTAATRRVDLGDPADNFFLPPADRMDVPRLAVVDDTVLVAHANVPKPTLDAYALSDLHQRWTGLPVVEGQDLARCGTALCIFDGVSSGSVINLLTGEQLGLIPPHAAPGDGSLVLLPVGRLVAPSDVAPSDVAPSDVIAVPSIGTGVSGKLPAGRDPHSPVPAGNATWLARWHVTTPDPAGPQTGAAVPIEILRGVDTQTCVVVAHYLACATAPDHLSLWRL